MGEDKSRLRLGRRTFVERAAVALASVSHGVRVVGSRAGAESHGLAVVRDMHEGLGAMGGLHAALAACRAKWAAVVSCDLPFVTAELFERLASFRNDEVDAIAPLQEDGRPQPLCALYAAARCLTEAERFIRAGELRPRTLLRTVRTRWVHFDELSDLQDARLLFTNVNTPEDYEKAVNREEP